MTSFKSELLRSLQARGNIHQATDLEGIDEQAAKGQLTAYVGFDPTGDSLHVGHLIGIMLLRRLQQAGHRPIVILGGATALIGDPSFRDDTRPLISKETVKTNIASIRSIFEKYLRFDDSPTGAILLDNAEWFDNLGYIDFLRDIGPHFTVNRMLGFDSVKLRMEREIPLTFLEFNYMILQAYDFVELNRRYGCTLQLGGSDQWGNIVNGVDLGRRILGKDLFGLTTPLLLTSGGVKMGKSVAGAVWLKADKLSPYDFWQFWRNTEDTDVGRFLKLFTDLPPDEVARLERLKDAEINEAKKILAFEATKMCHGEDAAQEAAETARKAFEGGKAEGLPTFSFAKGETPLVIDVAVALGMTASRGEAKRMIEQGGVRLNDQPVTDIAATIPPDALDAEGVARLSFGKKRHGLAKAS